MNFFYTMIKTLDFLYPLELGINILSENNQEKLILKITESY